VWALAPAARSAERDKQKLLEKLLQRSMLESDGDIGCGFMQLKAFRDNQTKRNDSVNASVSHASRRGGA
jgi:hypothetical protein